MTTTCYYFFQDEPGQPASSFQIPSKYVNVDQIRENFPFYGRFHFRSKQPPDAQGPIFSWLDLLSSEEPVPSVGGVIYLKVLQIPVDDDALTSSEKDPIDVDNCPNSFAEQDPGALDFTDMNQVRDRVDKVSQDLKKQTERATKATGKFLGKLWKSAAQTVESLQASVTNQRTPTSKAISQLSACEMSFSSPFVNGYCFQFMFACLDIAVHGVSMVANIFCFVASCWKIRFEEHEDLLVQLWQNVLPRKKYEAVSDKWKLLGFQVKRLECSAFTV
jgi:hypothetical protein